MRTIIAVVDIKRTKAITKKRIEAQPSNNFDISGGAGEGGGSAEFSHFDTNEDVSLANVSPSLILFYYYYY